MTNLVDKQQTTPNTDDYESKFLAFNGWLDAIRNAINEDDEAWKKAVNESLDDGFKNWLVSLSNERKEELKNKIREVLDKIKEQNSRFNQNDFSSLTALAQSLQIQWYTNTSENSNNQGTETATEQTSGLWLTGTLWSIDILNIREQTTGKFYWDINKATQNGGQSEENGWNPTENWGQQQESQNQSELDKTKYNINYYIDSIKSLLYSDKIKNLQNTQDPKKSLTEIQTLLENFQKIIENPSKKNVNELQKYIYQNLSSTTEQETFAHENHMKNNWNFDGQFGASTLKWLNTVLGNINTYLKSLQPEKNEWAEENPLKDVEVNSEIFLEWKTNVVATDLLKNLPDGAKAEFKYEKWINNRETEPQKVIVVVKDKNGEILGEITITATVDTVSKKVTLKKEETWNPTTATAAAIPEATKPTAPEKITVNGEVHSIATEPPANKFWWALYYINNWENPEAQNNTLDINGDREYLMKMGENVYKVKIDQSWNLCPTAINMISNVPVVMKNSTSGKAYIENKLPPVLKGKCIIWWDWDDYTIALPWWWKKLTIEPMTIDWKWIWSLTDSLAFLNLTNYLRNSWKMKDFEFKNDNPDLKLEWNELYVRVKKTRDANWKKVKWFKVNKYDFWLTDKVELLTKFIKYNNGEKWEDDWDRKRPNRYYSKIDLRWEAQLQVAWWSSQAPNSPFVGVNVHPQPRPAAEIGSPSNDILHGLGMELKSDFSNEKYGINQETKVYKKPNLADDNIYYVESDKITLMSIIEPWIKKTANSKPAIQSIDDVANWQPEANVSEKWKEGLDDKLSNILSEIEPELTDEQKKQISIDISDSNPNQYVLKNGDKEISITSEILTKDFCGKNKLEDKLKILFLASKHLDSLWNVTKVELTQYWIDDDNMAEFNHFLQELNVHNRNEYKPHVAEK